MLCTCKLWWIQTNHRSRNQLTSLNAWKICASFPRKRKWAATVQFLFLFFPSYSVFIFPYNQLWGLLDKCDINSMGLLRTKSWHWSCHLDLSRLPVEQNPILRRLVPLRQSLYRWNSASDKVKTISLLYTFHACLFLKDRFTFFSANLSLSEVLNHYRHHTSSTPGTTLQTQITVSASAESHALWFVCIHCQSGKTVQVTDCTFTINTARPKHFDQD